MSNDAPFDFDLRPWAHSCRPLSSNCTTSNDDLMLGISTILHVQSQLDVVTFFWYNAVAKE